MIGRLIALGLLVWSIGFVVFGVTLPDPSTVARTDGIVVLTGGPGRVQRGLQVLAADRAKRMLVSGVDPVVRDVEFDAVQAVPARLSACCIDLGKQAKDTVTNAIEAADWAKRNRIRSVRLVTSDWHMRRAALEFDRALGADVLVVEDAVETAPGLVTLFVEYNKFLARRVMMVLQK